MKLDELMSNPLYEALKLAVGMLSLHGYEDEAKKVVAEARLLSASKPPAQSDSAKWIREAVESLKRSTDGYDLVIARHLDELPADAEKPNDPQAVTRLKLLCHKLGLDSAIPDEIYSDPDGLFVIFGQMRARIEALLAASNAAPEQCNKPPEGWTCSRVNGHEGPCAASSQPSPTAVVLDDERAAFEAWIRTLEGHPFARQFANLMWKAWQARASYMSPENDEASGASWWLPLAVAADAVAKSADIWHGFGIQDAKVCVDAYISAKEGLK